MTDSAYQLLIRGTKAYVVHADVLFNEPVWRKLWWPIKGSAYDVRSRGLEGVKLHGERHGFGHVYTVEGAHGLYIELLHGGKTEAEFVETGPILPPKVRKGIQVRWHQGRWEKLLKSGWVGA